MTNTASTGQDSVLIKMATSNGQPLWATSWGSSGGLADTLSGLAVDSKNNVIATGREVEHAVVFVVHLPLLSIAQSPATHAKTHTTGFYQGAVQILGLPVLAPFMLGKENGYGACIERSRFTAWIRPKSPMNPSILDFACWVIELATSIP